MLRSEGFVPSTKTINIILMNGGLGDHIASLTVIDYINKKYSWVTILLWMPDFLVEFAKNVLPDVKNIRAYSEMKGRYEPSKPTKTTEWDGKTSPMKIHLVDYAFLKLCDENPDITHKNYLKIDRSKIQTHDLPKDYVVITTGYTAKVREFPAQSINEIAKYVKSKGYAVVFLGQKQTKTGAQHIIKGEFDKEIDFTAGIDMIDKTTLLQAAVIMDDAKVVLGVDNGLIHLAGCTNTRIIAGFTTVSPNIRLPIRNNILGWNCDSVVPDDNLECRFCQEKTNFLYGHDYTKCIYKDNLCTTHMSSIKFINYLEKFL